MARNSKPILSFGPRDQGGRRGALEGTRTGEPRPRHFSIAALARLNGGVPVLRFDGVEPRNDNGSVPRILSISGFCRRLAGSSDPLRTPFAPPWRDIMPFIQKITPCLWFDDEAEEAVEFYTAIFRN